MQKWTHKETNRTEHRTEKYKYSHLILDKEAKKTTLEKKPV